VGFIMGGCFIDALGLIGLTSPTISPIMYPFGFNLIWFGVFTGLLAETGEIKPPVGENGFVAKGVAPDVLLGKFSLALFLFYWPFLSRSFFSLLFQACPHFFHHLLNNIEDGTVFPLRIKYCPTKGDEINICKKSVKLNLRPMFWLLVPVPGG
jgi:TRAP-type C4-dicarboxylate transport system permease large subunit